MARAVLKYAFAAVLALLCTQAAVPSPRMAAGIEIVCSTQTKQQNPQKARIRFNLRVRPATPTYSSRTRPEPTAAVLFQRPPPAPLLFL